MDTLADLQPRQPSASLFQVMAFFAFLAIVVAIVRTLVRRFWRRN